MSKKTFVSDEYRVPYGRIASKDLFISDLWLEILPRRLHRSGSDYGNVLCELEG